MKKHFLLLLTLSCILTACSPRQDNPSMADSDVSSVSSEETNNDEELSSESSDTNGTNETITVSPLPSAIDINHLENCSLAISLSEDAVSTDDSGETQMTVSVYTYDLYDMVDISMLKKGDTLHINQKDLVIESLEENEYGTLLINGGLDHGGHELRTEENGVYFETGYSDVKSYYTLGDATLPVSSDFVYIDASDLDNGEKIYSLEEFQELYSEISFLFQPGGTEILVENGVITSLTRIYTP